MNTNKKVSESKDLVILEKLKIARRAILKELHKVIVGQDACVDEILTCMFANGHGLLVGVPGLAKTLMIKTLSDILKLSFNRIQFTPDLMPSDITGTEIIEEDAATGKRSFRFVQGPIFAHIVLADEINRTPPKTQAALLEAMQERSVTAAGETRMLEVPFFVLATQNPIEQEGTYPLPEAQLDRFMFNIKIGYPTAVEEEDIVRNTTSIASQKVEQVLDAADILELQKLVRSLPVSDQVVAYAVRLSRMSRPEDETAPDFIKEWLNWGAGPRASQYLVLGAKARAALDGRLVPDIQDVKAIAVPVLRHRLVPNFNAEAENINSEDIVHRLMESVSE